MSRKTVVTGKNILSHTDSRKTTSPLCIAYFNQIENNGIPFESRLTQTC